MAKMDWVPARSYNDISSAILPLSQANFSLLDVGPFQDRTEVVGRIEETPTFKVVRIVGYWSLAAANLPTTGEAIVRCWPGFLETAIGVPIVPGFNSDPIAANEKFWWERIVPTVDITVNNSPWDRCEARAHPWNIFMDIRPNMWMGASMMPMVSVENQTNADIQFIQRFRLLTVSK